MLWQLIRAYTCFSIIPAANTLTLTPDLYAGSVVLLLASS